MKETFHHALLGAISACGLAVLWAAAGKMAATVLSL